MTSTDSPKALSPPRTMWPNLMSFSFVAVPSAQKVAPKSFLDLGLISEKTYAQNCWLEITELEKAYALVYNLDYVRTNHTFKSHDISRPSPSPQPNRCSTQTHSHKNDIKARVLNGTTKTKALNSPKLVREPSATNAKVTDI